MMFLVKNLTERIALSLSKFFEKKFQVNKFLSELSISVLYLIKT